MKTAKILLFDGNCVICNGFAQFLLERDRERKFLFGTLQSGKGLELREKFNISEGIDSVILLKDNKSYIYSDAAIETIKELPYWGWITLLYVFPKSFRNMVYKWIAKNRYSWFGRRESCRIPSPEERDRFMD